jgi:phenylpyruvate tautomerase PptA (4-oxalocrotonate tautomerase family)
MQGKPAQFRAAVGDAVHRAMVESINCPPQDRFQVITEHGKGDIVYDPAYLGIARGDGIVLIQITLNAGRSVELKRALYAKIAGLLESELKIRREDVMINLVEVPKENWSFGNGVASYAQ